jgi:lysophospholipase L1-like esterase
METQMVVSAGPMALHERSAHSESPSSACQADFPVPAEERRDQSSTRRLFERLRLGVRRARAGRHLDALFLGDSLALGWSSRRAGRRALERTFVGWRCLALGVGGDQVRHLRRRIERGLIDGLSAPVIVVCIGANQLGKRYTVDVTVAEIRSLVLQIQRRIPTLHIVLCGILPQDPGWDWCVRDKIVDINRRLSRLALPGCTYVDAHALLAPSGTPRPGCFSDGVHLTRLGYEFWAEQLRIPIADATSRVLPENPHRVGVSRSRGVTRRWPRPEREGRRASSE